MKKISMPCHHIVKPNIEVLIKKPSVNDPVDWLGPEVQQRVVGFHHSLTGYKKTPLIELSSLSKKLGVRSVFVKDESARFGLNAFKALGGSYAIANIAAEKLGIPFENITFQHLLSPEIQKEIKPLTFITATDGNHGKGVAWFASRIGCRSVVVLPKNPAKARVDAIRQQHADVILTELNYDDAVRHASELAEQNGWILVQDTVWQGYEKIPTWITQGYLTMVNEVFDQLQNNTGEITHVFLQAGVGSMAGAVLGALTHYFQDNLPTTIIIEPVNAACILQSAKADDGRCHAVKGNHETIMAGLACGEPNTKTWDILRDFASAYIACDDDFSRAGIHLLARPISPDPPIVSGESAAAGMGILSALMMNKDLFQIKEYLKLNHESKILFFSTEGDTDPVMYQSILKSTSLNMPYQWI